MKQKVSVPAMIALTGILAAPVIVAAQPASTAAPGTAPAMTAPAPISTTTPGAAVMTPSPAMAIDSGKSSYLTADQRVRASKVVGASVYNAQNDKIGSVDDVLVNAKGDISGVVLSVGGFLGIASKLVEVPYAELQVHGDRLVISGATKDQLTQLPAYKYASN
jgi:sporulation protein YlmC with PRC-barrel domain